MKVYRINEIFYSIQGEGVRAGTPAIFVRFSGCNVGCTKAKQGFDCDTDHSHFEELTLEELCDRIQAAGPLRGWVVLTGGEPMLQVDADLIRRLHLSWRIAVETNGTIKVPMGIDWVTVSPKRGTEIEQRTADELKVVLAKGERLWNAGTDSQHLLISPAFDGLDVDRETMEWCVEMVKREPEWRLSVQLHKLIGVR